MAEQMPNLLSGLRPDYRPLLDRLNLEFLPGGVEIAIAEPRDLNIQDLEMILTPESVGNVLQFILPVKSFNTDKNYQEYMQNVHASLSSYVKELARQTQRRGYVTHERGMRAITKESSAPASTTWQRPDALLNAYGQALPAISGDGHTVPGAVTPIPNNSVGTSTNPHNAQTPILRDNRAELGVGAEHGSFHNSSGHGTDQSYNLIPPDLLHMQNLSIQDSNENLLAQLANVPFYGNMSGSPLHGEEALESAAKSYRSSASSSHCELLFSGPLPKRQYHTKIYSRKVFFGGVPWDTNEEVLKTALMHYGRIEVEWPGREGKHPRYPPKGNFHFPGYVYILFESDQRVKQLLDNVQRKIENGTDRYYFCLNTGRSRKEVQIIPWIQEDASFTMQHGVRIDNNKTVFVGALHGMMNAQGLAYIMDMMFKNVIFAAIDVDKHRYPIGSGRVAFSSEFSYTRAVKAAYLRVNTPDKRIQKVLQIDPFLEDSMCSMCRTQLGPFFCRSIKCFAYYCSNCWDLRHSYNSDLNHKPLKRNSRAASSEDNSLNSSSIGYGSFNFPSAATSPAAISSLMNCQQALAPLASSMPAGYNNMLTSPVLPAPLLNNNTSAMCKFYDGNNNQFSQ